MTGDPARLTSGRLVAALGLPADALVQQRIPKKMLADKGAPTPADRKLIQEHIEEATWVAALKPVNAGVPAYEDPTRTYLELTVLAIQLRGLKQTHGANSTIQRIAELLHRAIPYPALLVLEDEDRLLLSMAHIRWAQKEADKTVLDGAVTLTALRPEGDEGDEGGAVESPAQQAFLEALPLHRQPRTNLYALYQGWIDTLGAWEAVAVSGRFVPSASPEHAAQRRAALQRCRELDALLSQLRSTATKEKQMARQVAANLEIRALLAERQRVAASI